MEKIRTILKAQISLLTSILLFISLNSFSANVKFYNISDIYGITSGEAFSVCKINMVLFGLLLKQEF